MVAALDLGCGEVDRLDLETGCVTACIAACADTPSVRNMPQQEVNGNLKGEVLMCAWAHQQPMTWTMVTIVMVRQQAIH